MDPKKEATAPTGAVGVSDRLWIVQPKRSTDAPRVIYMAEAVPEWERLGYVVDGPYVRERDSL